MQRKGVRSDRPVKIGFAAARLIASGTRQRAARRVSFTRHWLTPRAGILTARYARLTCSFIAMLLTLGLLSTTGCATFRNNDEAIIKVQTKRDTARANRLTDAGIRALHKQQIDLAAKRFREAIEADYMYGPAHNNLGLMHYEQGNLYQAVMAFEQARELLPSDPSVVYNLGLTLESAGRTSEALELYAIANSMDRAHPYYLGNLVRLRVRMGEYDDILGQQLRDLVLIETRPDWRRWADTQLALSQNDLLDRGPATPDFESTANQTLDRDRTNLRNKIIDLTPVMPASAVEPFPNESGFDDLPDDPPDSAPPANDAPMDLVPPEPVATEEQALEEGFVEDLTEDDYYRK